MYDKSIAFLIVVLALGLMAQPVSAELVGHWRLNEGGGTVAMDSSDQGNDGTLQGDPEWVAGRWGGALHFDGVDDYVEIPHDPSLTVDSEVTVMAWINAERHEGPGGAGWQGILGKSNGPRSYSLYTEADGQLHFSTGGTGTSSTGTVPLNEWVHVAAIVVDGGHRYYLNGQPAGTAGSGITLPGTSDTATVRIGAMNEASREFAGMIDDVRLYNEALTENELQVAMQDEPYPQAMPMDPQDGTMVDQIRHTIKWRPGDLAVSHLVYFGTSFEDVNDALVEPITTTEATLNSWDIPGYEAGLTPGTIYYWRVDEVNDVHPDSPWRGDVWSYSVRPLTAWGPSPDDGDPYVTLNQALTWQPGLGALFHTVYLSDSFDEVNDATSSMLMMTDPTYQPPEPFEADKTYYWRIDEFTQSGTQKGEVWSFTTVPPIEVTNPDLVGWWKLDEGRGTTAVDWSGHDNHGSFVGSPQWVIGYEGTGLGLNGTTDYVEIPHDETLTVDNEVTVMAWINTTSLDSAYQGVVAKGNTTRSYSLYATSSGTLHFSTTSAGAYVGSNSQALIVPNEWIHVAAQVIDGHHQYYINGEDAGQGGADITLPGAADADTVRIGNTQEGGRTFSGTIDEVRIYKVALTQDEVAEAMRGDVTLAWNPSPTRGAMVDIRNVASLSWSAGQTAASHDVYFGSDVDALIAADPNSAEYMGRQTNTGYSLAGLIEFGGGDYYWRVDEVDADGTVHTGSVWAFTVPDYLIVDDFESYSTEVGERVFEVWIDGIGFTLPEPGDPGNGTGAMVGHDIWSGDTTYTTIMEIDDVYDGSQAMPIYYSGALSEVDRTFSPGQDWTAEGVTTLMVYFRGQADNTGQLYVTINGVEVPYSGDPADIAGTDWVEWPIDLASVGTNLANVTALTIGIENGDGVLYIDGLRLTKP